MLKSIFKKNGKLELQSFGFIIFRKILLIFYKYHLYAKFMAEFNGVLKNCVLANWLSNSYVKLQKLRI